MLWVAIASTYVATLAALDAVYTVIAVSRLDADPLTLGFLGAVWIASYSIAARNTTKIADSGGVNVVKLLSIAFLTLSIAMLISIGMKSLLFLTLSYSMLAIALASGRSALSTTIFENFDSSHWSAVTNFNTLYTSFMRGALLAIIALLSIDRILNLDLLATLIILTALGYLLTVKSPAIMVERRLFIAEKSIKRASLGFRAVVAIEDSYPASIDRHRVLEAAWSGSRKASTLLISLGLFVLSNELALTPLPYYLNLVHGASDTLLLYGSAAALSAIAASVIVSSMGNGYRDAVLLALIKTAMIPLLAYTSTLLIALGILVAMYATTTSFEIAIYGMYVDETAGYRMDRYYTVCEVAAVLGSLTSGYLAIAFSYTTLLLIASATTVISIAFLLAGYRLKTYL